METKVKRAPHEPELNKEYFVVSIYENEYVDTADIEDGELVMKPQHVEFDARVNILTIALDTIDGKEEYITCDGRKLATNLEACEGLNWTNLYAKDEQKTHFRKPVQVLAFYENEEDAYKAMEDHISFRMQEEKRSVRECLMKINDHEKEFIKLYPFYAEAKGHRMKIKYHKAKGDGLVFTDGLIEMADKNQIDE